MQKAIFLLLLLLPVCARAVDEETIQGIETTENSRQPMLIIINSYNETRKSVIDIEPIVRSASIHKVKVNVEHVETSRVCNDSTYNVAVESLFNKYRKDHPDYVVIAGGMGATFIQRIRQEWGDSIPMVYVGVTNFVGKRSDYYTGVDDYVDFSTWQSIDSVFPDANLLFVSQPYFAEKTVDLMVRTMPQLKKLVFIGDNKWINRYYDYLITSYIQRHYPRLGYEWLICNDTKSHDRVNDLLAEYDPERGLLMSTWSYDRPSLLGFPVLVTQDYNTLTTTPNPVFSLSPLYMQLGSVGGHYYDQKTFNANVNNAIDRMMGGEYLDTIPDYLMPVGVDMLSYPRYMETIQALGPVPDGVVMANEPPSLWQQYRWLFIILMVVIVAGSLVMYIVVKNQRTRMAFLRQLDGIVQGMPVAFMVVQVKLDDNGRIISHSFSDRNRRYVDMIRENGLDVRKGAYYESMRNLLMQQVQAAFLTPENRPVTYTKFFPESGKTYEWIFKRDSQLDRCYVYGVDISELAKSRRNLASTKSLLEMALLSARLIPWIWDTAAKRLAYDRIRVQRHTTDDLEGVTVSRRGYIDNRRLLNLIFPDDRVKLATVYNDLMAGKIKRWEGTMRIAGTTAPNPSYYYSATITALVLDSDDKGKALTISGAILIDSGIDEPSAPSTENAKAPDAPAETNRDIIIVEPYDSNFMLYEAILSRQYDVHRVIDREQTEQLLKTIVPGLVIINIDTADSKDIREIFDYGYTLYPDVPVVALTSHATTINTMPEHIRGRFTTILTLPVTPTNLLLEISRLLHA